MCPVRKGVCVCTVCPGKCAPHGQDMCGAHFVGHTVHTYFTNIYTYILISKLSTMLMYQLGSYSIGYVSKFRCNETV